MAGKKGRSGRRTKAHDLEIEGYITKAWKIVGQVLNDKNLKPMEKLDTAKMVVARDISRNQKHTVTPDIKYISQIPEPATETKLLSDGKVSKVINASLTDGLSDDKSEPEKKVNSEEEKKSQK